MFHIISKLSAFQTYHFGLMNKTVTTINPNMFLKLFILPSRSVLYRSFASIPTSINYTSCGFRVGRPGRLYWLLSDLMKTGGNWTQIVPKQVQLGADTFNQDILHPVLCVDCLTGIARDTAPKTQKKRIWPLHTCCTIWSYNIRSQKLCHKSILLQDVKLYKPFPSCSSRSSGSPLLLQQLLQ